MDLVPVLFASIHIGLGASFLRYSHQLPRTKSYKRKRISIGFSLAAVEPLERKGSKSARLLLLLYPRAQTQGRFNNKQRLAPSCPDEKELIRANSFHILINL
ncbi:hypothetical protein LguiB_035943 [Lonicera macranthoides]